MHGQTPSFPASRNPDSAKSAEAHIAICHLTLATRRRKIIRSITLLGG